MGSSSSKKDHHYTDRLETSLITTQAGWPEEGGCFLCGSARCDCEGSAASVGDSVLDEAAHLKDLEQTIETTEADSDETDSKIEVELQLQTGTKWINVTRSEVVSTAVARGLGCPVQQIERIEFGNEPLRKEDTFHDLDIEDGGRIAVDRTVPKGMVSWTKDGSICQHGCDLCALYRAITVKHRGEYSDGTCYCFKCHKKRGKKN